MVKRLVKRKKLSAKNCKFYVILPVLFTIKELLIYKRILCLKSLVGISVNRKRTLKTIRIVLCLQTRKKLTLLVFVKILGLHWKLLVICQQFQLVWSYIPNPRSQYIPKHILGCIGMCWDAYISLIFKIICSSINTTTVTIHLQQTVFWWRLITFDKCW